MTGWTEEDLDKMVDDAVFRLKYEQAVVGTPEEQAARIAALKQWLVQKADKKYEDDLDKMYLIADWVQRLSYRCLMGDHTHCFNHSSMCTCTCHNQW